MGSISKRGIIETQFWEEVDSQIPSLAPSSQTTLSPIYQKLEIFFMKKLQQGGRRPGLRQEMEGGAMMMTKVK